jgi:hypothetical protein
MTAQRTRMPVQGAKAAVARAMPAVAALMAVVGVAAGWPAPAPARTPPPRLLWVDCWPRTCARAPAVAPGTRLLVAALNARGPVYVEFSSRRPGRPVLARAHRRSATRLLVTVPPGAATGRVRVRAGQLRSNRSRIVRVLAPRRPAGSGTAFDGTGVWIWVLGRSDGGDLTAIATRAHANGVRTVFLKSSDGTNAWAQFSAQNVATLKAAGVHVCAWQYVYGDDPRGEAAVGAQAVAAGADCLVIDAESEYEGRYAQARTYISELRAAIGPAYPVGLAGFPYVDYHPAFPYSVFLGPGGAQFDLPQMYWRDIGTTVDQVYAHTWPLNRVYQRPIFPLGQLYNDPPPAEIARFRTLAAAYGASGTSWWDWQEATAGGWQALAAPLQPPGGPPPAAASAWPTLARGAQGDLVMWAQEHLAGAGEAIVVDGAFGPATDAAVRDFQSRHGLPVTGAVDAATWPPLLAAPAVTASRAAYTSRAVSERTAGTR